MDLFLCWLKIGDENASTTEYWSMKYERWMECVCVCMLCVRYFVHKYFHFYDCTRTFIFFFPAKSAFISVRYSFFYSIFIAFIPSVWQMNEFIYVWSVVCVCVETEFVFLLFHFGLRCIDSKVLSNILCSLLLHLFFYVNSMAQRNFPMTVLSAVRGMHHRRLAALSINPNHSSMRPPVIGIHRRQVHTRHNHRRHPITQLDIHRI